MKGTKTLLSYLIFIIGLQWKTIYVASVDECPPNYFKCRKNGRCIIKSFVCDGENDCEDDDTDYSDEEGCKSKTTKSQNEEVQCKVNEFQCANKKCILKSYLCDSFDDCGDKSDESAVDGPKCASECPKNMFKCKKSGKCIYRSYLCDSEVDCGRDEDGNVDNSDETENCGEFKCGSGEFKCNDYRCIDKDWVCDGSDDCGDNSDELNCKKSDSPSSSTYSNQTIKTTPTPVTAKKTTAPGESLSKDCNILKFYCPKDDTCIHDNWVCDGMKDCTDGFDERPGLCKKCEDNEFKCHNGTCIPNSWTCDGKPQCLSGEDENLEKCNVSIPCTKETFKCKDTEMCINKSHICDDVKNCPSGDDEASCGIDECKVNNGGCSHHCVDEKVGHTCACPVGFNLGKDKRTCIDINECALAGSCSQICRNTEGSYHCDCDDGYMLLSDKKTCRAKAPLPYLIFSSKTDIRQATTNFKDYKAVTRNQVEKSNSVDVDVSKKMIYFSDVLRKRISRIPREKSSAAPEILVENVIVKSLAVNWISQNLFWTDGERIFVSNLNGGHKKTFLAAKNGEVFHSLVVVPERGMLFWSDIGSNPKIESMTLSGTKRSTLFNSGNAKPSLLTVDRNMLHLFWVDAADNKIASLNLREGGSSSYRVVTKLHSKVSGLAVFEDFIYFTSHNEGEVNKINKFNGENIGKYSVDSPSAIAVYHPLLQRKVYHPCQDMNGGCSHLCFISDMNPNDVKCACPDTMQLFSDGKTCFAKESTYNPCIGGHKCKITNQCIPKNMVCNGVKNCAFNDDESDCGTVSRANQPGEQAPQNKIEEGDRVNILLPIGICAAVLVLLVLAVVMVIQYRKKKQKMEMSMVYEKENNVSDGHDGKVDVEIKYVPNNKQTHRSSLHRSNKNFENKNYVETSSEVPLVDESINDCEMMVDESDSSSDNTSENNVLIS